MAKAIPVKIDMRKAELVANWLIRFNDPEKGQKKLEEAERLCILNGMESGEFTTIITTGNFNKYQYSELLEINKIINGKKRKK